MSKMIGYVLQLYGEYSEDVRNGRYYAFVPLIFEKMKKEYPDKRFRVIQVQKEQQDMHWSKSGEWKYF